MALPVGATTAAGAADGRALKWAAWLTAGMVLVPAVLIVGVVAPAQHAADACSDFIGLGDDPIGSSVGQLGGVSGTGITRAELATVRRAHPPRLTAGEYVATSYGPPWGGIQGSGQSTAGGLLLNGGAPRKYFVAVDPGLVSYGTWLYIWPNPFQWRGAFLSADTGGAIRGRRIDFYDWRGRVSQRAWGSRSVRVSSRPATSGGEETTPMSPGFGLLPVAAGSQECLPAVAGSGAGQEAVRRAIEFLGRDARQSPFPGFAPPSTSQPWCAWFVTNLWKLSGVPIKVDLYSGYPYTWAASGRRELLLKAAGQRARTLVLPVGTALMYGAGPTSSDHINLVRARNADGTVQIIGGNQGNSRVTSYGPCRLTNGAFVRLSGPGCDPRPIYGIVAPSAPEETEA